MENIIIGNNLGMVNISSEITDIEMNAQSKSNENELYVVVSTEN